jgi:hypothetical protein
MTVVADIVALWRRPRATFRAKLAQGPREDRALAVLMGACALFFVAQWPIHARAAHLDPSVPLDARLGGALMANILLLPLIGYGLAALSHLAVRALGGQGAHWAARLALFWAMLATAPLMLVYGAVAGLAGPGPAPGTLGLSVFLAFGWLWMTLLRTAAAGEPSWT